MVGLLDIAEIVETVEVRGRAVSVYGVSAKGFAYLLNQFPELRMFMTGRGEDVTAERLFEIAPNAIAAIIACGTGAPGNEKAEAVAASLAVAEQVEIITKIIKLTFPKGVGPFVQDIQSLGLLGGDVAAFGREVGTTSQEPLKN